MFRIGLISDTHGLLRPEASAFLQGCDHIVHGGDIGHAGILESLEAIAPLTVVRGNNDGDAWADRIAHTELVTLGGVLLCALHDVSKLDVDLVAARVQVVVSGHSHKPAIETVGGVLFVNPGSAGPRRFKLPISVGELVIEAGAIKPRIVTLAT